ncbi:hypothetical protein HYH03_002909 [Edaphochlamys debaryana]|uniref:Phospholipid scramblase n=1 Tax=Edaphochlamys debaryana TaxID=47281 RepID=A0A836C4V9_9CHLO|nr:hypothetical protein HYH03_002909 [Edaphochlamys debaryana]|eukprot:KAG2499333.1 hypothetical protein HYH03_002909 [Edaphochlamys debaryana]
MPPPPSAYPYQPNGGYPPTSSPTATSPTSYAPQPMASAPPPQYAAAPAAPPSAYPVAPTAAPSPPAYAAPTAAAAGAPMPMPPYAAPGAQAMDSSGIPLTGVRGVVVQEATQIVDAVMEAVGGPYEAANKYKVLPIPADKRLAVEHGDPGWLPTRAELDALSPLAMAVEKSSCLLRMCLACWGGLNLRALELHFTNPSGQPVFRADRPCRCGAGCCCPLEMTMYDGQGRMLGMVEEKCEGCCWEQCCLCTYTHNVLVGGSRQSLVHKYSLVNASCCCGRVSNCCGATCCKPNFFIDVTDPQGRLVAAAYKTYGGEGGCSAMCRCCFEFNQYVLPFPKDATQQDRLLLLLGLLSIEYAYHSRQGGEGDD